MDERALIDRLAQLDSPDGEMSRKRAIGAVPRRVRAAAAVGGGRARSLSVRTAAVAAALLLAMTSFALFTPPGHAVTSWVGDRFGTGEPGGEPSLGEFREIGDRGTPAEGQPARVLHVGPAPGGRYEFITYRPRTGEDGQAGTWPVSEPCFEVDLTQLRAKTGQDCGVLPGGPNLYLTTGVAGEDSGTVFISGRTSSAVSSLEATRDGEPLEVELVPIPLELVERLELGQTFNFFIAFVDGAESGGTISVTARDSSGRVLAQQDTRLPDVAGVQDAICEMAKRLFREGAGPRERVQESCPAPPEG